MALAVVGQMLDFFGVLSERSAVRRRVIGNINVERSKAWEIGENLTIEVSTFNVCRAIGKEQT